MTHTKEQPTESLTWFEGDDCVASIEVFDDVVLFKFYGANSLHVRSIPKHLIDATAHRLTLLFGPYNHFRR